jgi:hypothetical protein
MSCAKGVVKRKEKPTLATTQSDTHEHAHHANHTTHCATDAAYHKALAITVYISLTLFFSPLPSLYKYQIRLFLTFSSFRTCHYYHTAKTMEQEGEYKNATSFIQQLEKFSANSSNLEKV